MRCVKVSASKKYDVLIDHNILSKCGELVLNQFPKCEKIVIVTDDIVDSLYSETCVNSLKDKGFSVCKFVFKNGEASKTTDTFVRIAEFLAENKITRSDALVALGGGVVGDMCGFAAATYLRGISFVQIPTTLLAMVDSSVGGKTAVNLSCGKNLLGAFYQPDLVLCDLSTLDTLKQDVFNDGVAEVIKYGVIKDYSLFELLENQDIKENIGVVVQRCVEIKAEVVKNDELDRGERQLLNFGHTIGHAVEKCSNYKISHGSAVAIGMAIFAKSAFVAGISLQECSDRIKKLITKYNLPISCGYDKNQLLEVALSDKKRTGSSLTIVVPKCLGKCVLHTIKTEDLLAFIEKGL